MWKPKHIGIITNELHRKYLKKAYTYAFNNSDDISTKNGSLLVSREGVVLCYGANRFPKGVKKLPERNERPMKYSFMEHAERDVIYVAVQQGIKTKGLVLYTPWFACHDCGRAIIGAGMSVVIGHKGIMDRTTERWQKSIDSALDMMHEAGVKMFMYDGKIGVKGKFDDKVWTP